MTYYVYDNNGNMTLKTHAQIAPASGENNHIISLDLPEDYSRYTYDGFNRLKTFTSGDTFIVYRYDGNNLRTEKIINGEYIGYIYEGDRLAFEYIGDDEYAYNYGYDLVDCTLNGTETKYYMTDHHGNVSKIHDASYNVVNNYNYDAFGNEHDITESWYNPFNYCGEYTDEETGFVYLRNRYYDPQIGRFITEDPVKDGFNWYAYCGNNPVNYIDPLGLEWFLLRQTVESLPNSSVSWTDSTSTATVNIGGVTASFQNGTDGVRINSNGKMEVWSDTFATAFMPTNGERIFIGSHSVAVTGNHAGVIIMVDSRSSFWNDDRFIGSDKSLFGGGIRFATIGAGPSDSNAKTNTLRAQYDYDVDIIKGNGGRLRLEHLTGGSTSALFECAEYFMANHNSGHGAYEYFATPRVNSNHFNSNSFAHGLLLAAGVTPPRKSSSVLWGFPGWDGGPRLESLGVFGVQEGRE